MASLIENETPSWDEVSSTHDISTDILDEFEISTIVALISGETETTEASTVCNLTS